VLNRMRAVHLGISIDENSHLDNSDPLASTDDPMLSLTYFLSLLRSPLVLPLVSPFAFTLI
jgi:hypothetical protein